MYTLVFITAMTNLGVYPDIQSCQNAIREIISVQLNPPNQRLKEIEPAIDIKLKYQKVYVCVPEKKS